MQKYETQVTSWKENFDEPQKIILNAAKDYRNKYPSAGFPGDNLFIIAKQAEILDQYERMISVMASLTFPVAIDVQNNHKEEIELAKMLHESAFTQ